MSNVFDRLVSGKEADPNPTNAPSPPPRTAVNTEAATEAAATSADVKEVTQELLRYGYLEEARKPVLFQRTVVRERDAQMGSGRD